MNSWYTIRAQSTGAEVVIYDEIGAYGVSAKGFLAELAALPDATPLALRLNSPGGSVFDAVAIYNAIKRHSGAVTVWIDGIAASAASYIAMAGDEVIMPENAFLMIHDPAGVVMGTAIDMRAMAEALDKIKGSLLQGYAAKSGRPQEEIAPLMAAETWLDAKDALDLGFADRIAEPVRIAARFDVGRFRNAPPELAEAVADADEDDPSGGAAAAVDDAGDEPATDHEGESAGGEDAHGSESQPADPGPPADMEAAPAETHAVSTIAADIRTEALTPRPRGRRSMPSRRTTADGGPVPRARHRYRRSSAPLVLATRAEAVPDISAAHPQPGRPSGARPWGDVIARTFRLKG